MRPGAAEPVPASPITAAIGRALGERGWVVHHQVGCGPYKLDLAIVDPRDPGRYVFAIEHDGAAYASAPGARDRDRLRAQVLAQLGWRVHRIWALDWWADPERELQRAHGAIVMAVAATRQRKTLGVAASPAPQRSDRRDRGMRASAGDPSRAVITGAAHGRATPGRGEERAADRVADANARMVQDTRDDNGGSDAGPRAGSGPNAPASRDTGNASQSDGPEPRPSPAPSARTRASRRARDVDSAGGAVAPPGHASGTQPTAGTPVAAGSGPNDAVAALVGDLRASVASGSAPIRIAKNMIAIGPYLAAAIPAGRRAPDDLFAARHAGELGKIIEQVLAAEAPMHVDVLARRVGAYFGIGRLTTRVSDQVRLALAGRAQWGDEDNVVWRLDQDPAGVPAVRVAGQGASARREIAEVPLCEVAAAARIVVERAAGIAANDLVRDAARLLGFARVTEHVIERVASGVRLAARRELIRIEGGKAMLPDHTGSP
jgi:very-short-patch-repair endonuclease